MKNKSKILYNSGMMNKAMLNECTDDYIRTEEIKNKVSDAFNKLMREIMYARDDAAGSFRYGMYGHHEEKDEAERKKMKNELREFIMVKYNKLKEVIEEYLGKANEEHHEEKEKSNSEGNDKGEVKDKDDKGESKD